MPVRGTTVARHQKEIIIRESNEHEGQRILCSWLDCDNYGYQQYQFVVNEAKPGFAKKLCRYAFCSEQCMTYFRRSHIPGQYGMLPAGMRSRYM